MAKKNKTDQLKSWKPGQSGNPGGLPKGLMRRADERLGWAKLLKLRLSELKAVMEGDPSSFEAMAAACIYRATVEGDMTACNQILDRACGKPKEEDRGDPLDEALRLIPEDRLLALLPVVS